MNLSQYVIYIYVRVFLGSLAMFLLFVDKLATLISKDHDLFNQLIQLIYLCQLNCYDSLVLAIKSPYLY